MFLAFMFSIIKRICSLIIKAVAWVLVALSLWVPLLYSIVFVIVCGFTHTKLGDVSTIYFSGLAASFVVSFLISSYLYERNHKKTKATAKAAIGNIQEVRQKEARAEIRKKTLSDDSGNYGVSEGGLNGGNDSNSNMRAVNNMPAANNMQAVNNVQPANVQTATGGFAAADGINNKTSGYNDSSEASVYPQDKLPAYGNTRESEENRQVRFGVYSQDDGGLSGFAKSRAEEAAEDVSSFGGFGFEGNQSLAAGITLNSERQLSEERPKIFATKSDPTIFIYEYADRLEFFKRTRQGMVFMDSRRKQA